MSCAAARSPRILVVRRPARHQQADEREAGDGHDVEEPQVQEADRPIARERHRDEGEEGGHEDGEGRQLEDPAVGRGRAQVLLADQLERVGQRLERPVRPDVHRAQPHLDPRRHLPLDVDQRQHDERHQHDHGEQPQEGIQPGVFDVHVDA
jgi:hypothetical protein